MDSDVIPPVQLPLRFPRLIYLNGPSGTGKTELANYLASLDSGIAVYHHATPITQGANLLNDYLPDGQFSFNEELNFDSQPIKDSRLDPTTAYTWRDYLIAQGKLLRQMWGPAILGRIACKFAAEELAIDKDTIIFPAARTIEDIGPIMELCPFRDQVMLNLVRKDCAWDSDIGMYIDASKVPFRSTIIHNEGSLQDFFNTVVAYLTEN